MEGTSSALTFTVCDVVLEIGVIPSGMVSLRVLMLYSESWMTSPPIPNPRSENEPSGVWPIVGPSLQQEGWCLTYHTEMSARGMSTSVTPTDPSLLDIAKFAIKSRMGMADLF